MNDKQRLVEEFRRDLQTVGRYIETSGFLYAPELDVVTPTMVALAYVGRYVAFVFTLAFRNQVVDASLIRCIEGKLTPGGEDGYSASLVAYLVNHCDFRGQLRPMPGLPDTASKTARDLSALVALLLLPCSSKLLADKPDSLPKR